jgi:hypothetical protein
MSSQVPSAPVIHVEFNFVGGSSAATPSLLATPMVVVDVSPEEAARLPFDPNAISPEAASSNTSFHYSGRHDFGSISQLNNQGYYRDLVAALQYAKQKCDTIIVQHEETGVAASESSKTESAQPEDGDHPDDDGEVASKKAKQG